MYEFSIFIGQNELNNLKNTYQYEYYKKLS